MFLLASARNAAPISVSAAVAASLPERVAQHLGLHIPVVQRAHWARGIVTAAAAYAYDAAVARMPQVRGSLSIVIIAHVSDIVSQVPQMQPGWEFRVNARGRSWYAHADTGQVQLWRPELCEEVALDEEEEEEDPEVVAQREAATAAAALTELIASLKTRQAELAASVAALQGKTDALVKALKTKKGDALKAGQAQQQALEMEIKAATQDLAQTKSQIADAQKKLPAPSKVGGGVVVKAGPGKDDMSGKKATAVAGGKQISRSNTVASSKSPAPPASAKKPLAASKPAPMSRSSTLASTSSASASSAPVSSSALQKQASKTAPPAAPPPAPEAKQFGRAVEGLDKKLLVISDEVCLHIDEQMWAPIKKLSFFPVSEKLPANAAAAAAPAPASSAPAVTPSKTAANTPVKAAATPLNRSGSSSTSTGATPLSSARK
jgi:hypothetical protein